ncbi:MAG: hypothetical protein WBV37_10255 [Nocardioidaceae bacterium]
MSDGAGVFRYEYVLNVDEVVRTALWLRRGLLYLSGAVALCGLLSIGSGLASHSGWFMLFGLLLLVEVPLLIAVQVRRFRRNYAANQGLHRVITFSPDGIMSQGLVAVSFGWDYFTAWSLRRDSLIFVRHVGRQRLHFLVVPTGAIPDDEWQQLTTTLFERLGPARRPDVVRRPTLTRAAGVGKPGEVAPRHP